jgi:metal-sulfur cluster biosynthetic enzyme
MSEEASMQAPPPASLTAGEGASQIRERVIEQLRAVFDPEIPVNIYHELGLIYEVTVDDAGQVAIRMTLTSPMCPAAEQLPPRSRPRRAASRGFLGEAGSVWDRPGTRA